MIKAVVIEDEPRSRKFLKDLLLEMNGKVIFEGEADNVKDALELIQDKNPDLVFLDVEMRGETGFDLLEKLEGINLPAQHAALDIVFTTAHEHYALKAIQFAALDYLLKPIDRNDLIRAIERAQVKQEQKGLNKNLRVLIQNIRNNNSDLQQLALSTSDGIEFIRVIEIIYCESDGPYTRFFLKSGRILMTSKNLKEYEELLSAHHFYRVHHSFLVNIREIKKYVRGEGGQVLMSSGAYIDVSKRKKDAFLKVISNY